jgi:hypothetical protein
MTDDLTYFTEVLKRLETLSDRASPKKDIQLAALAADAADAIGELVGYLAG